MNQHWTLVISLCLIWLFTQSTFLSLFFYLTITHNTITTMADEVILVCRFFRYKGVVCLKTYAWGVVYSREYVALVSCFSI